MKTAPKSASMTVLKHSSILAISFALFCSNGLRAEVPERAQRALLSKAPQIDSNGDKKISMEELE